MYALLFLALSSFLLSLLLTPLCRNLCRRWGVLDPPDSGRKLHKEALPRVGGIPIMCAYLGAVALFLLSPLSTQASAEAGFQWAWKVLPAAVLVLALGLVDDLRGLKPWQKLAGQLVAAPAAFYAGVRITAIAGFSLDLWLSLPATIVWLVCCCNALNLIDGVDGLATGAGWFATVTIVLGALLQDNLALAVATVPLAGALLGFLRYNSSPASIFLGDSGSLTLGFMLGCYGVVWGQKSATAIGMAAPLIALGVPLLDTAIAILRRFLRRQPIMNADRAHIHHRLLDRGLTPRKVVLLLYSACALAAALSLLQSVAGNYFGAVVAVVFCGAVWIGVQRLGYVEFAVAGRMLVDGTFRHHLVSRLALRALQDALSKARTVDERRLAIRNACREFGFTYLQLRLDGRTWSEPLAEIRGGTSWEIRIPLPEGDYVRISQPFNTRAHPTVLGPLVETIRDHLTRSPANLLRPARLPRPRPELVARDARAGANM